MLLLRGRGFTFQIPVKKWIIKARYEKTFTAE